MQRILRIHQEYVINTEIVYICADIVCLSIFVSYLKDCFRYASTNLVASEGLLSLGITIQIVFLLHLRDSVRYAYT